MVRLIALALLSGCCASSTSPTQQEAKVILETLDVLYEAGLKHIPEHTDMPQIVRLDRQLAVQDTCGEHTDGCWYPHCWSITYQRQDYAVLVHETVHFAIQAHGGSDSNHDRYPELWEAAEELADEY